MSKSDNACSHNTSYADIVNRPRAVNGNFVTPAGDQLDKIARIRNSAFPITAPERVLIGPREDAKDLFKSATDTMCHILLCAASKILETLAFKHLSNYISERKLLDTFQSGFRKYHSTHTALVSLADDIKESIDDKKIVLTVAIDHTRAFDLVNPDLVKLKELGVSDSACSWVCSYLPNRTQVIAYDGKTSSFASRILGVLQGSPIGPLFFSLFANDASLVIQHCKYHMYADDLTIYCSGTFDQRDLILHQINSDLQNIATWGAANCLSINGRKSQAIWFGSRTYIKKLSTQRIREPMINGKCIKYEEAVKILGVTLDNSLTWIPHCIATAKKCHAALGRLRKCNDILPSSVKLLLIKALVFPHLDYCAGLFLNLSKEMALKLDRSKNAALPFATRWQED